MQTGTELKPGKEAFIDSYNRYYPLIFSIVFSKLGIIDDTKDICQEVFIRFYENLGNIQNPRKWLYGTMKNVVMDFFKQKKPAIAEEDFDSIGVSYINGFRDTRVMIQEAMESMDNFENDKDRVLFELIAVHNFSYKEAGRHTGMNERRAKYRYGLITKKILMHFKNKGIDSLEDLL